MKPVKIQDEGTDLHCRRVEALILGYVESHPDKFSMGEEMIIAARIHDLGKNKIPNSIINSPNKLSNEERETINMHAFYGYQMAKNAGYSDNVCEMVLLHHGDDKPFGENMKISAEIKRHAQFLQTVDAYDTFLNMTRHADFLRVIDAYDAMLNPRSYHNGRTEDDVFKMLRDSDEFPNEMVALLEEWEDRKVIQAAFRKDNSFDVRAKEEEVPSEMHHFRVECSDVVDMDKLLKNKGDILESIADINDFSDEEARQQDLIIVTHSDENTFFGNGKNFTVMYKGPNGKEDIREIMPSVQVGIVEKLREMGQYAVTCSKACKTTNSIFRSGTHIENIETTKMQAVDDLRQKQICANNIEVDLRPDISILAPMQNDRVFSK
jgi:hypothetical protein